MTVYINNSCISGPYLSPHKLWQMPSHIGPAPIDKALQYAVQFCIDCAVQPKAIISFFKPSPRGTIFLSGKCTDCNKNNYTLKNMIFR